ncbi:hypothetical protein KM043_003474 [Ampulex compressa]|nr:hypothetical protein KM043_003474 [Ampulex compressa]
MARSTDKSPNGSFLWKIEKMGRWSYNVSPTKHPSAKSASMRPEINVARTKNMPTLLSSWSERRRICFWREFTELEGQTWRKSPGAMRINHPTRFAKRNSANLGEGRG